MSLCEDYVVCGFVVGIARKGARLFGEHAVELPRWILQCTATTVLVVDLKLWTFLETFTCYYVHGGDRISSSLSTSRA